MELFLVGEHGGVVSTSGKESVKRARRTRTRGTKGVGLEKNGYSSSLREEIRLMLYLASRTMKDGQEPVSETTEFADSLSSRCA